MYLRAIGKAFTTTVAASALGASSLAIAAQAPDLSKLPPLIDRELLFGDPDIAAPQISPDGKYLAFIRPYNGIRNIWVKRTEQSFDQAKPVTAEAKRPIGGYFWSRDGKFLLYVRDNDGDETSTSMPSIRWRPRPREQQYRAHAI